MEIRNGEYIRTKDGVIAKVTATGYGIDCDRDVFDLKCLQMMEIPPEHVQEYVIKHSFNIIDLIEVGDIVDGFKVFGIFERKGHEKVVCDTPDDDFYGNFATNKDIFSVVTKEQFKAMEYEVK